MKIRFDFVSNSSSTSFIIVCDKELVDFNYFLNMMGCDSQSPLKMFYKQIHNKIIDSYKISKKRDYFLNETLKENYDISDTAWKKIVEGFNSGCEIWLGRFGLESDDSERFMCGDAFVVEKEGFYFDGLNTEI